MPLSSLQGSIASAAAAQAYVATVIRLPGGPPLGYWRLASTDSLLDEMGVRNGSWMTAGGSLVPGLPTGSDGAVDFKAVATGRVTHDAGLELPAFSLSFWFKPNDLASGDDPIVAPLLTKNQSTNAAGDLQVLMSEEGFVRVRFQDGTGNHNLESPLGSVVSGEPHHLCIRADNTGFDAYLDGQYLGKITGFTGAWTSNTADLLFAANTAAPQIANVVIDEVAIFNRVLTESEIFELAQASADPVAADDQIAVPESATTPIDVTANDTFVGSKSELIVQVVSQPGGGDSVAVNENNDIAYTAGAVAADTARSFTYRITDQNGTSNTATVNVTVTDAVALSADLPFFGQYYGGGWPSAQNGEYRLRGQPSYFFFHAERSGEVVGFQWSWRTLNPGTTYSQGDGGTYTFEIVEADASTKREQSGGAIIASVTGIQPGNPSGSMSRFVEYDFSATGSLVAGQPYVFKVTNTHGNAGGNYASQNVVRYYVWHSETGNNFIEPGGGPGAGEILAASGGIRGHAVGSSIARVRGYAPHSIEMGGSNFLLYPVPVGSEGSELKWRRLGGIHCALRYSDGIHTLWGRGSGNIADDTLGISGSTQLRQRFRVTRASRTVRGVFIMGWVNGTSGNLNVLLESGPETDAHFPDNGTLIEQVSVPANMFLNAGTTLQHNQFQTGSDTGALELVHYVWVPFSQNRTLALGQTYNLRLVPANGISFFMAGGARGDTDYGLNGREASTWSAWALNRRISWTCWEDSRGPQVSTDGGTTWNYFPGSKQQVPITFKCV